MKISELPSPYRELAEKNRSDSDTCLDNNTDDISEAFFWEDSLQGYSFWNNCNEAKSEDDLPPLPNKSTPQDTQAGGDHYTRLKIQPLEIILANDLNFLEGNIIKYVLRHRHKGMEKDLRKAIDCLEKLINHEYKDNDTE